ncbi:hypothetical protein CDL12_24030 [Handroanthus impetiginosus]|uniref:Transposase Tnp1/En/Spm-like domain-containing protein n=1 Tax=Handroanthus impetiginosus TaxID=429701 RepID=A0A2G9GDS5_9LAMI|nr:hypothetical protein CDL12_24030 [Handroanthus impetiginosus]
MRLQYPLHSLLKLKHNQQVNHRNMLDVNQSNFGLFKPEGATRTTKLKVRDVFHLPLRVQIVVQFDEQFAPYGEKQGILVGFCESLANDSSMFPINFKTWRNMPKSYLDHCWDNAIKKWTANRLTIWNEFYDPTKGRNELIRNVPNGIGRDQWANYIDHHLHPETQSIKYGHPIGRGYLFLATHKHQDGSWVNDMEKEQGTLGKEHLGRVRCIGLTVTPTSSFGNTSLRLHGLCGSSSNSGTNNEQNEDRLGQLESQQKSTLNAFKTNILIKERRIPDELASAFDPVSQNVFQRVPTN